MPPSARNIAVRERLPGRVIRVLNGETHLGWLSLFEHERANGRRFVIAPHSGRNRHRTGAQRRRRVRDSRRSGTACSTIASRDANILREEAAAAGIALAAQLLRRGARGGRPARLFLPPANCRRSRPDFAGKRCRARSIFARTATVRVRSRGPRAVDASNARTAAALYRVPPLAENWRLWSPAASARSKVLRRFAAALRRPMPRWLSDAAF